MKSNWLIAVEAAEYEQMQVLLIKKRIRILNRMDEIFVLQVQATAAAIDPFKQTKGVIAIEPEGTATVQ